MNRVANVLMKIISFLYYLFRRIFDEPIDFHIISDVLDSKKYIELNQEFMCFHWDYGVYQDKSAKWRLTREFLVNNLDAVAIKILHSKTEHYGGLTVSYFKPCILKR